MQYFFGIIIFLLSLFLILLILIQRGRGGGLAGAFGGMGGQSAFGTKAGDLFTRITIGVAFVWIVMSVAAIKFLNRSQSVFGEPGAAKSAFSNSPASKDATSPSGSGLLESPGTEGESVPAAGSGSLISGDGTTKESAEKTASPPAAATPAETTPAATTPESTPPAEAPEGAKK